VEREEKGKKNERLVILNYPIKKIIKKIMILRRGSRGKFVVILQNLLGLLADGVFGKKTEEAVIKKQKELGLKSDGIVGPNTWKAISGLEEKEIKPIITEKEIDNKEDFSDPDEAILNLETPKEENAPTCKNVIELIDLIENAIITRNINRLIFHCTATHQNASVSSILSYWKNQLKWKNPGYHIIIKSDGSWTLLADFNSITNGVAGFNSTSINVSYIGGVDERGRAIDNRTQKQVEIMWLIYELFNEKIKNIETRGHNFFTNKKECPSFDVGKWITQMSA
jgi:N-acetylmuramoyl-L-alanine amidase